MFHPASSGKRRVLVPASEGSVAIPPSNRLRRAAHRASPPVAAAPAVPAAMELLEPRLVMSAYLVTNLADAGAGSLRDALAQANADGGPSVIDFQANLSGTVSLSTAGDGSAGPAALLVTGDVTVDGNDGGTGLTIARDPGASAMRLFTVAPGGRLTVNDLTLTGGLALGGNGGSHGRGAGGGAAGLGGAVFNEGTFTATDSTFTANQAVGGNGGTGSGGPNDGSGGGAGGGGLGSDGSDGTSSLGGAGGGPNGGAAGNASQTGQPGGFGGGGGGGAPSSVNPNQAAGDGGFGAGGGSRGFGGGHGGVGGFGGGGGFGSSGGTGGFAGGAQSGTAGGGGAGLGGAVFNYHGAVSLLGSTLTSNSAAGGSAGNGFAPSAGRGLGAAVFNYDGSLSLSDNTLTTNTSNDGGPGVYTVGDGPVADLRAPFAVGTPGAFTFTTDARSGSTLSASAALPAGLTFTDNGNGTATIAGTPAPGSVGRYTISPVSSGGTVVGSNATQTITLDVYGPPAITSADHAAFNAGSANSFTVRTTYLPTAALGVTGTLPAGVTFQDNGDGTATLAGTPGPSAQGTYNLSLDASNALGNAPTQAFTLTVGVPPTFTTPAVEAFQTGAAGTFIVRTSGSPSAAVTETGTLPAGVTFTPGPNGTAVFAGTPAPGTGGDYALTLTASNGFSPDATQSFTFTVLQAPAVTSATRAQFDLGQAGSFTVTTTGFPGTDLSAAGALPAGLTFTDNGDGTATLAGTPAPGSQGEYPLAVLASNGVGEDAGQTLTLSVGTPPTVTSADHVTFTAGAPGTFTVGTSGIPTAALGEAGALPPGVTFTDNGDGTATLAGTPDANSGGTYHFGVSANNGFAPDAAQPFTLTVDQAPAITSAASASFTAGAAGSFTVATAGFPAAALAEAGTLPAGVTFTDNGDGTATLAGTPAPNATGAYRLTVSASNGVGSAATQPFVLTVGKPPVITSAATESFTARSNGAFIIRTTGFPAASLSEAGTLPAGVTFRDRGNGTALLSGTPAAGTGGVYPLALTASNGFSPAATQSFTLTVNGAPSFTSPTKAIFTPGTFGSFTVTTTGYPQVALAEAGTLPAGVTFTDNGDGTATLAGTPAPGSEANYPVTLGADNGVGPSATQSLRVVVASPASVTSADHATFTAGAADSFSITTAGFPAAALGLTGTLPAGVVFHDNGDGTATLSGTPAAGTGGTYPLSLAAANDLGGAGPQAFTLTVAQPPAISSATGATFAAGSAASFTVTTSGFPAATLAATGTLPQGVTFTDNGDGTATLSGTPDANAGGAYPLTLTASNGTAPDASQPFSLVVAQPSSITSADHATFTAGAPAAFQVTTAGFPAASLTAAGALPQGVTLTENGDGTATLSGTPALTTGGEYDFALNASNGVGNAAGQPFTLTVDHAPAVTSADHATFTVGTAGSFTVATTGFPAAALTESGTLPSGLSFRDNGDGTATLSGAPAAGTGGSYALTLSATNGTAPDAAQAFTLTIDQAPEIISSPAGATFTAGSTGTFTVRATGFPGAALAESGTLPAGLSFHDNGDGTATLAGTPAVNAGGTYDLTFTATNGVDPGASQPFTLTVRQSASVTSADHATFTVGTAGSFTVTTAGFPAAALTEAGTLPAGLTFQDNGDGTATIAGTPAAHAGGVYALTLSASNGVGSAASQPFTLTVDQAASLTGADHATFTAGAAGSFTVTTAGFPSATLTRSGGLPVGVTFHDNGDGTATLSGTPEADAGGTYALTLGASNGVGAAASQSFTLTVNQSPAVTSADHATFTAGAAGSFTVTTAGFPAAAVSRAGGLPAGLTFHDNGNGTATIAGTPAPGTGGAYPLTLAASNAVGAAAAQSFRLTVNQVATFTSDAGATFRAGEAGSFTVTTAGFPTPSLAESGALPAGLTFTDNGDGTATIAGTPAPGAAGAYALTLAATNGSGAPTTQSLALTVSRAPALTGATAATFPVGRPSSFTFRTTGFPAPALAVAGDLPGGVTFHDNGDGTATLAGTPTANTGGTYALTVVAGNGAGPDAAEDFALTITNGPAVQTTTLAVGPASSAAPNRAAGSSIRFALDKPLSAGPSSTAFSLFLNDGNQSSQMTAANRVPITGVTYDPATGTVSVRTAKPLKPGRLYVLTADAAAIHGTDGTPLDGTGHGDVGTPLTLRFATGRRLKYIDAGGNVVTLSLGGPGSMELVRRPDGQGDALILTGATAATTLTGTARRPLLAGGAKATTTLSFILGLGRGRNLLPAAQFSVATVSKAR